MEENGPWSTLEAEEDWNRARRKVLYQEVVCFLKQCPVDLLSFEEARGRLHLGQKIDRGLQEISLDHIRGSVGRYDDFTSAFLPRKGHLQKRWERVDAAVKSGRIPPIEVYQVGDAYFVLDGNHRVSVARQQGWETIEAYVCEFPTPYGLSPDADLDELLIRSEQVEFAERVGRAGPQGLHEIVFTCSGCYDALLEMIEACRQALEKAGGHRVSTEQAAVAWYGEVYRPAIEAIRKSNLLARFPKRTEADLFLWASKHNRVLERRVHEDEVG